MRVPWLTEKNVGYDIVYVCYLSFFKTVTYKFAVNIEDIVALKKAGKLRQFL